MGQFVNLFFQNKSVNGKDASSAHLDKTVVLNAVNTYAESTHIHYVQNVERKTKGIILFNRVKKKPSWEIKSEIGQVFKK